MSKNKIILSGILIGVDFVKKGQFKNDEGEIIKYNDSIKLKLNMPVEIVKQDITTNTIRLITLKLAVEDSIEDDVAKYNKEIGKTIEAELVPLDNQSFNVSGDLKIKGSSI